MEPKGEPLAGTANRGRIWLLMAILILVAVLVIWWLVASMTPQPVEPVPPAEVGALAPPAPAARAV